MRVAYRKSTGEILHAQSSDGELDVIQRNALSAFPDCPVSDLIVERQSEEQYSALLKRQVPSKAMLAVAIEQEAGMNRRERELAMLLPAGSFWRARAETAEKKINALGVRE